MSIVTIIKFLVSIPFIPYMQFCSFFFFFFFFFFFLSFFLTSCCLVPIFFSELLFFFLIISRYFVPYHVSLLLIFRYWLWLSSYVQYDVGKTKFVKKTLLDDIWWDKVDYLLYFNSPIYNVLKKQNTYATSLPLAYEMWDSTIVK